MLDGATVHAPAGSAAGCPGFLPSSSPRRPASQAAGSAWSTQRHRRSRARRRWRSASICGTPSPASTPTSAAGTTPVSRVQHRKAISGARPLRAPVRQRAGEHGDAGARSAAAPQEPPSAGSRLCPSASKGMLAPRTTNTNRVTRSATLKANWRSSRSCLECIARPESLHVADDQPGEKGAEVAAAAGRVEREVADRDHGEHRAAADDSRQIPARRLEIVAASRTPATIPITVLIPRLATKSRAGVAIDPSPLIRTPAKREREHRSGRVVERRLGDHRLGDLWPQPRADEQRNQDRGIGGGQDRAHQHRPGPGEVEGEVRGESVTSAVMITPGMTSIPSPIQTRCRTSSERLRPP